MAKAFILYKKRLQIRYLESKTLRAKIKAPSSRGVKIDSTLQFRVKFIPIGIEGVSSLVPPIPLQVIGYSNYIL